jgi:glycosyltransferase involved in cell wall biosynthesis
MRQGKVTFVYNGRVEVDEFGNYYGNELNDILVERYRMLAYRVEFLIRTKKIKRKDAGRFSAFNAEHFTITPLPEFNSPIKFLGSYSRLSAIIKEALCNTDILVARLPSTTGRIAIEYAKNNGIPYLIEVVGCPWDALWNHSLVGKMFAPYAFFKMKLLVRHAPFVQYVTSQFLQNRYPTLGFSIGLSDVIIPALDSYVLEQRLKRIESNDFKRSPIVLATIAGIDVKYKGQDIVFQALSRLKKKGLQCQYYLIGKGTGKRLKSIARKLDIADNVIFYGEMPRRKIFDFLNEIDIYIQPSFQEGLPRSVVEAMSQACPIIGSDAGGTPELISNEMVFSKGDLKGLISIFQSLNKDYLMKLARMNFEKAREFEFSSLEERRQKFYEQFLRSLPIQ